MAYFQTTEIESSNFYGSSDSNSMLFPRFDTPLNDSNSSPWSEIISKYLNGTSEKQLDEHRDLIDFGFPVCCRENEESGCSSDARRRRHSHHRRHRHHKHKHQHRFLLLKLINRWGIVNSGKLFLYKHMKRFSLCQTHKSIRVCTIRGNCEVSVVIPTSAQVSTFK